MVCRGAKELVPFLRQLKTLEIPLLAVVSDKERGLLGYTRETAIAEKLETAGGPRKRLGRSL